MLEVTDLRVSYGQSEVIHGLSLRAEPKKILAVMGRNGTGKTTLFRALIGLLPTRAGSIKVGGARDLAAWRASTAWAKAWPMSRRGA